MKILMMTSFYEKETTISIRSGIAQINKDTISGSQNNYSLKIHLH